MPTIEVAGVKISYESIGEVSAAIQKEITTRSARLTKLDKERQALKAEIRKLKASLGGGQPKKVAHHATVAA